MPFYTAYGLIIESDTEVPELAVSQLVGQESDVSIRQALVPEMGGIDRCSKGRAFRLNSHEILYTKEACGRFLIRGGSEIEVEPEPGVEDRVWRLSLFGPALGLLLIQRGLLVLHGGAVVWPGGAVLLLGPGGCGKSTLTGELCKQGGGLLTDDVVAIDMDGPHPRVLPGVPLLKLWPDAVDSAPEGAWTKILHPDFEKLGRRMDDSALANPAPVARIFILGGGECLAREKLSGAQAFRALMASQFAARYGEAFVTGLDGKDLLGKVTRLLELAPVELLRRPKDRGLLADTAAMVKAAVQS